MTKRCDRGCFPNVVDCSNCGYESAWNHFGEVYVCISCRYFEKPSLKPTVCEQCGQPWSFEHQTQLESPTTTITKVRSKNMSDQQ